MMIEADVSLGHVKHLPTLSKIPIMAHPPLTSSDLTLEDFLDTILNQAKPKGIKLDIKHIEVLEETLTIIKSRESKVYLLENISNNELTD